MRWGTCEACGREDRRLRSRRANKRGGGLIWACADDDVICRAVARKLSQRAWRQRQALERREHPAQHDQQGGQGEAEENAEEQDCR